MFPIFNMLKFVQTLKNAGMAEPLAIALSEAQNEIMLETANHLFATKSDFHELKEEITLLQHDMVDLRHEFKHDMADLRYELKQDIADLKSNQKLQQWMMGFVLTGIVGIAGLVIKSLFII